MPDWSGDDPQAGVSWEEVRKGFPPDEEDNHPEQATRDECFASQQQTHGTPSRSWTPTNESPSDRQPDWPPDPPAAE